MKKTSLIFMVPWRHFSESIFPGNNGDPMALPSTIYKAVIQLSDLDRGIYETLQATVARHPSETEERLVARLLAWVLFYGEELVFTKGVSAGDEPDLWSKGPDGRVGAWIEVGQPEAERLLKAARHAEQTGLLACGTALHTWERQQLDKLRNSTVTVIAIEQSYIAQLVKQLERSISWSVTITEGSMYLQINNETFETVPRRLTS
jgi:uncharacterized protein YaeQ